jgi:hypothetical protein
MFPIPVELQAEQALFRITFLDHTDKRNHMAEPTPEKPKIEVLNTFDGKLFTPTASEPSSSTNPRPEFTKISG